MADLKKLLDSGGVDAVIVELYGHTEKGIALLRIHHAVENTEAQIQTVAHWIFTGLDVGTWDDVIAQAATLAAIKLRVLANELEKSIPVLREAHGQGRLRRDDPQTPSEAADGGERAAKDGWDDVPF